MARFITPGKSPVRYARFYKTGKAQATIVNATPIAITTFLPGVTSSTSATLATPSITPLANRLYLVSVTSLTLVSIVPSPPTLSGNGISWVSYANIIYDNSGTSLSRVTLFYGISASPTAGVLTADFAAQLQDTAILTIDEATNVDMLNPVVQGATGANVTAATDLTVPLGAFASTLNSTYAIFAKEVTAATATPLGGLANLTYYDVSGKITNQSAYLSGNTLTPGISWNPAVISGAIAIELKNISTAATVSLNALNVEANDTVNGSISTIINTNANNIELTDIVNSTIASIVSLNSATIEQVDVVSGSVSNLIGLNSSNLELPDTLIASLSIAVGLTGSNVELSDNTLANIATIVALSGKNIEVADSTLANISTVIALNSTNIELYDATNAVISTALALTSFSNELNDVVNGVLSFPLTLTASNIENNDVSIGLIGETIKVNSKVGGDDVPRKEKWENYKPSKKRDESLETIIKAAYNKATGKVTDLPVEIIENKPLVIYSIIESVLPELNDDEEDEILMLLLGM